MNYLSFVFSLALVVFHSVFARFIVEENSVSIISPNDLRAKYDGSIANFGVPDYGGSLVGSVIYPEKGANGCSAFEGDKPFKSTTSRPTILLLDRGDCYFALKAWNAQQAGAAATLIADTFDEPLITMDSPEESSDADGFIDKISIPSVLIQKSFGETLKNALKNKKDEDIVVKLDWTESMPHPDQRVEYQFWTNSNDECGIRCDEQMNFVKNFKGHAQILERGGYTMFTPHYITWFCLQPFTGTAQCVSQCINHGRYCAPDPEKDFGEGYNGKDVVFENLRQLCIHRVANESGRSWVWWDYVTDFHIRCSMKEKRYSKECAQDVMKSLDLPIDEIQKCMGDPTADVENEVLKIEQDVQVGKGSRGDVTILPTLVINDIQYRGKLERTAVLKAICAGFKETTEPRICLSADLETNECFDRNGGCWQDLKTNITACKDTYRGRICECPLANGVQYNGDGYTTCQAVGPRRCSINNGGCWSQTKNGKSLSACFVGYGYSRMPLPTRFPRGWPYMQDINECKQGLVCKCDGCTCTNRWGGYDCKCKGDSLYIQDQDTCINRNSTKAGWFVTFIVLAAIAATGLAGYIFYKYRFRSYMDSEILAIMSQYMPLDSQQSNQVVHHDNEPLHQGSSV